MFNPSVPADVAKIEFTREGLQAAGFEGFHPLYEQREESFEKVPDGPGVYAVLRESKTPVSFVNDPAAGLDRRWVSQAEVIYIGKADALRRRLSGLAVKGEGREVGDWGGSVIWQIGDTESLTVAWLGTVTARETGSIRSRLLDSFQAQHGVPPFGNQRKVK